MKHKPYPFHTDSRNHRVQALVNNLYFSSVFIMRDRITANYCLQSGFTLVVNFLYLFFDGSDSVLLTSSLFFLFSNLLTFRYYLIS